MPDAPNALIVRCPGSNCDAEMVRAFRSAGARAQLVHIDALIRDPAPIEKADLLGFPGGFSYGDDIASGRALAVRARERLYPRLKDAVERGALVIGVCNGFQVLCQIGLLPGPESGAWPDEPPPQRAALAENAGARFIDRWVGVRPEPASVCLWTKNLWPDDAPETERNAVLRYPIAHGEGRFTAPDDVLDALEANRQIALRYTENPNGSHRDIAGICDPSGRVFGLMPHPERFESWTRHPFWTRLDPSLREQRTPGQRVFDIAVAAAQREAV
jgi:phosphoribosylformylglycinamidine synthase